MKCCFGVTGKNKTTQTSRGRGIPFPGQKPPFFQKLSMDSAALSSLSPVPCVCAGIGGGSCPPSSGRTCWFAFEVLMWCAGGGVTVQFLPNMRWTKQIFVAFTASLQLASEVPESSQWELHDAVAFSRRPPSFPWSYPDFYSKMWISHWKPC